MELACIDSLSPVSSVAWLIDSGVWIVWMLCGETMWCFESAETLEEDNPLLSWQSCAFCASGGEKWLKTWTNFFFLNWGIVDYNVMLCSGEQKSDSVVHTYVAIFSDSLPLSAFRQCQV